MSTTFCTCIVLMSLAGGQVEYGPVPSDGEVIYEEAGSGLGGRGDQLFPYDAPEPWQHGYFQDIPAYGGYAHFRPHNYKHLFAQSQVSAGWGFTSEYPYSQQFWHRYEADASMKLHLPEYPTPSDPRRPGQQGAVSDIYQQSYEQAIPLGYDPSPRSTNRSQRRKPSNSPVYLTIPR